MDALLGCTASPRLQHRGTVLGVCRPPLDLALVGNEVLVSVPLEVGRLDPVPVGDVGDLPAVAELGIDVVTPVVAAHRTVVAGHRTPPDG